MHGPCRAPTMFSFQPLKVLQINLVVAADSGLTFTPWPNESGMGGVARLMALNAIVELVLAAVTWIPMSLPPVIVL